MFFGAWGGSRPQFFPGAGGALGSPHEIWTADIIILYYRPIPIGKSLVLPKATPLTRSQGNTSAYRPVTRSGPFIPDTIRRDEIRRYRTAWGLGLVKTCLPAGLNETARDSMPGAAVPRFELKPTKMWAAFSATVGTSSEAEHVLYTARSTAHRSTDPWPFP